MFAVAFLLPLISYHINPEYDDDGDDHEDYGDGDAGDIGGDSDDEEDARCLPYPAAAVGLIGNQFPSSFCLRCYSDRHQLLTILKTKLVLPFFQPFLTKPEKCPPPSLHSLSIAMKVSGKPL